nr:hypothetical protein Itr_chr12CG23460 [Ipomoea trifida]
MDCGKVLIGSCSILKSAVAVNTVPASSGIPNKIALPNKQRSNVVLTGRFEFSSGLGQFLSKSSDNLSALCSGESVGTSSSFSGAL